ncbi:hypothetical protein Tco_1103445 [Tanacetum coccineum]
MRTTTHQPPTDNSMACPLKEFKIKFSMMNGKKPLTLDYKTFVKPTGLDYNKGTYVSHPSLEAIKAELAKITIDANLLNRTQSKRLPFMWLGGFCLHLTTVDIDQNFRFLPRDLSNSNFSKDPSKVTEIELTATMINVNNQEYSVSPLSFSGKKKKGKSQTVSKPKPKTQGPEAFGTLPQKRKKAKTDKTTEATKTPPIEDVPTEDSEKTYSASSGQTAHPQYTEGNTQSAIKDPILHSMRALINHNLCLRSLNKNKGETSSEVELDTQTLLLVTAADVQALLLSHEELNDESEDDVFEARDEMDEGIQQTGNEDTHSLKHTKESSTEEHHQLGQAFNIYGLVSWSGLANIKLIQAAIQSGQTPPSSSVPTTTLVITKGPTTIRGRNLLTLPIKNLLFTLRGEKANMDTDEAVEKETTKELDKEQAEEEPAKISRAILISIVIPITRSNPEIRLIKFSPRPPLTNTTLEFPVSKPETEIIRSSFGPVIDVTLPEQPKSPPVAPKANKRKDIATEKLRNLQRSLCLHQEKFVRILMNQLESLIEGVPFVNNMVIKELNKPEYGIFFTDVFGDQAFQRWNDIHKVGVDSLVSYLVMALMVKTSGNAWFGLKLRKLIAEHLDQEKLQ